HTQDQVSAVARLQLPSGWRAEPGEIPLHFSTKAAETVAHVTVYPSERASLSDSLSVMLEYPNETEAKKAHAIRPISYEHIPKITESLPAQARRSNVEPGESAKHIGYLPGAGDLIPEVLREIGLQVAILNDQHILSGDLSLYDAIVTGVGLYSVIQRMLYMQPRLME